MFTTPVVQPASPLHPPIVSSFPPARDHDRAQELTAASNSFFLENWPFVSQEERDFFVRCNLAALATRLMPDGEFHKTSSACKIATLLFLADDVWENNSDAGGDFTPVRMAGLMRGELIPKPDSPVEQVVNRLFREMEANCGVDNYRQFIRLTREWTSSQGTVIPRSISEYMDWRGPNAAGNFGMALARYALAIFLTDEELRNPLLVVCERLVIDAVSLENDVISYEKELEQNTLGNNVVAISLQHGIDGHTFDSPSAAKNYVLKCVEDYEAKLPGAISEALADRVLGTSNAVGRWLHALPYFLGGNKWWSQETPRYNIPGKTVPRRVIHLEGVGNIVVPGA
ncbi:isoprenoid synthase domain-containing protein [Mycena polygramma]|nr:isoprenoid synthase domain-containing protein [Mycena polygramma]